jgi:hypothetical protein
MQFLFFRVQIVTEVGSCRFCKATRLSLQKTQKMIKDQYSVNKVDTINASIQGPSHEDRVLDAWEMPALQGRAR